MSNKVETECSNTDCLSCVWGEWVAWLVLFFPRCAPAWKTSVLKTRPAVPGSKSSPFVCEMWWNSDCLENRNLDLGIDKILYIIEDRLLKRAVVTILNVATIFVDTNSERYRLLKMIKPYISQSMDDILGKTQTFKSLLLLLPVGLVTHIGTDMRTTQNADNTCWSPPQQAAL